MLENGLYFVLGCLVAGLFALLVAPAIWRRAVALTRQRIENAIPISLHEIQADKDQMRAEFAMGQRKLEIDLEKSTTTAQERLIEINRKRDELQQLENLKKQKEERIVDLENELGAANIQLEELTEKLSQATISLADVETRLEQKNIAFDALEQRNRSMADDFDSQKIEAVARETRLSAQQDEILAVRRQVAEKVSEQEKLKSELKMTQHSLDTERSKIQQQATKLEDSMRQIADLEARLEIRDGDLAKLRQKGGVDAPPPPSGHNKALDDALSQNNALSKQIDAVRAENNQLQVRLRALELRNESQTSPQADENALTRERILELAAQVTAMTAAAEGPDSPINKALAKADKPKQAAPKKKATRSKKQKDDPDIPSLAERIRAVQTTDAERV